MVLENEASIETVARDKYKRAVGNVKLGRNSVNKAMKEQLRGQLFYLQASTLPL